MHHSLEVKRSAQLYTLGELNTQTQYVWVVLHGYAQHPGFWIRKCACLIQLPLTAVVAPEGLSKFYVAGQSGRVGASWMTSDNRNQEITDYIGYLTEVRKWIVAQAPHAKIVLLGFSQGGATAARVAAATPTDWENLVLWSAVFPPDMPTSQLDKLSGWMVYGKADPYLSTEIQMEIQRASYWPNFEKVVFEGGHDLDEACLSVLQQKIQA